jgi:hypothetical protein
MPMPTLAIRWSAGAKGFEWGRFGLEGEEFELKFSEAGSSIDFIFVFAVDFVSVKNFREV